MSNRVMYLEREDAEEVAERLAKYRDAVVAMASLLTAEQMLLLSERNIDAIKTACEVSLHLEQREGVNR